MEEGSLQGVGSEDGVVPKREVKTLEKRVKDLERLLGKKTMENEILQDALRIAQEKKTHIAIALIQEGRYSMRATSSTLGVARSKLKQKKHHKTQALHKSSR